ncbi:putative RING-H2 finger protein ATL21A [Camellia lanceoleosa]|uniref:RING-H2 finger protein ATL21A n=1 Tax=Camellia lanceoleosa TaxID=1840588 RepID=A0ACC0J276_9ERIC|nr:putative RING-H2 finger protein ATL21A [Camellia lanceoleosa]
MSGGSRSRSDDTETTAPSSGEHGRERQMRTTAPLQKRGVVDGVGGGSGNGQDECTPTTCSDDGPTIRFPFRLNNCQPQHCGYPGFDLSCSQTNDIVLDLPFSVKVFINYINYTSQSIHITGPDGCFPSQLRNLNLTSSPFQFSNSVSDFSLFSCPAKGQQFQYKTCIPSESGREVIAVYNDFFIFNLGLIYYYP